MTARPPTPPSLVTPIGQLLASPPGSPFVFCAQCASPLNVLRADVRACDAARMKCEPCKIEKIRSYRQRNPAKNKEYIRRQVERERRKRAEQAAQMSRCCECGKELPPPKQLIGWRQRKCSECKANARSRQRGYKSPIQKTNQYKERQRVRANAWYHNNKTRANDTKKKRFTEHYKHTEQYAAQLLAAHSNLKPSDIPKELRVVKLVHIETKRTVKKYENNASNP